jgi:glycosyltransferase involved in cell wall biosynthesis
MDVTADASKLPWPDRPAVQRFETKILRAAKQRLVLSQAIAADLRERFGLESIVIPHSIDLSVPPGTMAWPRREEKLIVHTGVVEGLQIEGLLRLAGVIGSHPGLHARLVLATPTPKDHLHACGFNLPHVEILKLTDIEVRALQRAAAVLVAVLPFHGEIAAYQLTAFPTKAVEYMTTGAPILAHAPRDSFFATHVREHGYALLIDDADPSALYEGLARLLTDPVACARLVEKAGTTVNEIYALPNVARRFAEACELAPSVLKPYPPP